MKTQKELIALLSNQVAEISMAAPREVLATYNTFVQAFVKFKLAVRDTKNAQALKDVTKIEDAIAGFESSKAFDK